MNFNKVSLEYTNKTFSIFIKLNYNINILETHWTTNKLCNKSNIKIDSFTILYYLNKTLFLFIKLWQQEKNLTGLKYISQ